MSRLNVTAIIGFFLEVHGCTRTMSPPNEKGMIQPVRGWMIDVNTFALIENGHFQGVDPRKPWFCWRFAERKLLPGVPALTPALDAEVECLRFGGYPA